MCVVRWNVVEFDVLYLKVYVFWKFEVYGVYIVRGIFILFVYYLLIFEF